MNIEINYLAVLVAALISFVLGGFWYSPAGFGKKWMAYMGWSTSSVESMEKKSIGTSYAMGLFAALVTAYVLAHFIVLFDAVTVGVGMQLAFWAWLGFIATTTVSSVLWEMKPKGLWFLNNAYSLISLLIMGAILSVWR